jgi:putative colanic acid biosynthesis acetyltransferase WcaF
MSEPIKASVDRDQLEGAPSFPLRHRLFRALWNVTWMSLAFWTPPPMHRWRRFLLRVFGADVHPTTRIYGWVRIWYPPNFSAKAHSSVGPGANIYCMGNITLGEKVVISQGAYLCGGTHDISDPHFTLVTRPIVIGARAWIAAEAFVGPGVTVNEGAVIGARAVLFKDAEAYGVYSGNPAVFIKKRVFRND